MNANASSVGAGDHVKPQTMGAGKRFLDEALCDTLAAMRLCYHEDCEERLDLPVAEHLRNSMTACSGERATKLSDPGAVSARHVRCSSSA
jgi:hypothetical protein